MRIDIVCMVISDLFDNGLSEKSIDRADEVFKLRDFFLF